MTATRIRLFGPLRTEREGVAVKLRTVQQGLLLAQLVAAGKSVDRVKIASLLWPEADRENALAYLRRAVMELRKAGFELLTPGTQIDLDRHACTSDVAELLESVEGAFSLLPKAEILQQVDHVAAVTIREAVREALHDRQRKKSTPPPVEAKGAQDLLAWLGDTLLQERPAEAASLIAAHGVTLVAEYASEPLLDLSLRALSSELPLDENRAMLRQIAARSAHILTRYALAERLYREALADGDALERPDLSLPNLSGLAFLQMEQRRWAEARETALRCAVEADQTDNPRTIEKAHTDLAGILWHQLEFDASVDHYLRAIEMAEPSKRIVPVANLAYLWGVFGVDPRMEFHPDLSESSSDGYRAIAEAYLRFSVGMGERDPVEAAIGASKLVGYTSTKAMERLFCVAIDCAAMALTLQGSTVPAAACVRLGTRLRCDVDHRRSAGERLAIRRNVQGPFFHRDVTTALTDLRSNDPRRLAEFVRTFLGDGRTD